MSVQENKAIVRRHVEEWNKEDNSVAIDELVGPPNMVEGYRKLHAEQVNTFSNRHYAVEDIFAEGDKVTVRLSFHGTFASTGEQKVSAGIQIYRISGAQIQGLWDVWQGGTLNIRAFAPSPG